MNAVPQSPKAVRASAKEIPNGSTAKPLRSGLRPPSKLKSNKYDHRNHTKNSAGIVGSESSESEEERRAGHGRSRQKPRRRKPKGRAKDPNSTITGATKLPPSSAERSQRSTERSPSAKCTVKSDDKINKDGNSEIKSKSRPRHPGRQGIRKHEGERVKMTTQKCNDRPHTKGNKSLVEVVTVETKSIVGSSAEVKNTSCKVTKDISKQAQVHAKCPEKSASSNALNYNNKARLEHGNSQKHDNKTTCVQCFTNSNCKTKYPQPQSVCLSKHSKLKTPSFCTSTSTSTTTCPGSSYTGCSIPKPGGPRAKTITTSNMRARQEDIAVNVNRRTETSRNGTGGIPTTLQGQMGDIIEQHPRQCKDNQGLLQCNSEATAEVEACNQPVQAGLDVTVLDDGVLVGEQHSSQCTGNIGNMDSYREGFQSTKTGFIKGTKGDMVGSKVLQEETCTEIRPNVIGNAPESPQRAPIMTSNKVAHKGTINQNESNEIDEKLHQSNHSKLPEISGGRSGELDVKSECNSTPAPNPCTNITTGTELVKFPVRDNGQQLGKSSADIVSAVLDKGPKPQATSVIKSNCTDKGNNSDMKNEAFRVVVCVTRDDSYHDDIDQVGALGERANILVPQSKNDVDNEDDKRPVKRKDNVTNNSQCDVITMTNGLSTDTTANTRTDSICEGQSQGDKMRDSVDICAKLTGLMSNKKETCNEVSVIGPLNRGGENTRADSHGVVNVMQEQSITSSAGFPQKHGGSAITYPSDDNAVLQGLTGSNIDRNVNNNLQMQSINDSTMSSACSLNSHQADGDGGCVEGNLTELGRGADLEDSAFVEGTAGEISEEDSFCKVKGKCHVGKEAIVNGETSIKGKFYENTQEARRKTSNKCPTSFSAVASRTPLPSNSAGQMSRSGEQIVVEPCLIAGEQFPGKCVNETKKRNCDQLPSSPAPSPSGCSSPVMGINEPAVPNSQAVLKPLPPNEENSRDFSLHRLHECHPTTKATWNSASSSGCRGNVPPFSGESNNNEVNGQLLLRHDHSEGSSSEKRDITQSSKPTTSTHYSNNMTTSFPVLDSQITQFTDKDRDVTDEGERCCEAGAGGVACKAAFLHEDTKGLSQERFRGQAVPAQHTHSKTSPNASQAIDSHRSPDHISKNISYPVQAKTKILDQSHKSSTSMAATKPQVVHKEAGQVENCKREMGAVDKKSSVSQGYDESDRILRGTAPSLSSSDREHDSTTSQKHQKMIESEIEYAVANSPTTPQATETGPIDFDRSKYEAALASDSINTADVKKVVPLQPPQQQNVVKIEDYSFRHVLVGLGNDKTKGSLSASPENICTKDCGDKTMASPSQKQHDNMLDSYTEFDSGFVQSPPECSENELEFALPTVDTCQNNITSSHALPDTCQNIPSETQTNGTINTDLVSDLSHESKFNAELRQGHNNGSTGDVPVSDSALSQKLKSTKDGGIQVYDTDKVCDPKNDEKKRVKIPGVNDIRSDETCNAGSEHDYDKDSNFQGNMPNIKPDLTTVLCDVNDSLMNINLDSSAWVEPDNHGSKDSNKAACNLNHKTITSPSNQLSPASLPLPDGNIVSMADSSSEMTMTKIKPGRYEVDDKSTNNLNKSVGQESVPKSKMAEASSCTDDKADDDNRCIFFLSDGDEYENTCEDTLEGFKALKKGSMSDFEDFELEEDSNTCRLSYREGKESKVAPARSASSHNFQRRDPERRKAKYGIASFLMESAPLHRATATSSLNVKSECEAQEVLTGATPEAENPTLQFPKFKETVVSQTSLHTSFYEDSNEYLNMLNCLNGKNLRRDNSDPCHMAKVGQGDLNVTNDMQRLKNDLEMKELLANINQFTSENNNQLETGNDGFDTVTNATNVTSSSMEDSITADDSEPKSLSSEMTESASDNNMMVSSTCSSASSSQMEVEHGESECSCSESVKSLATTPTNEEQRSIRASIVTTPTKSKIPSPKGNISKVSRIPKPGGTVKESGTSKKVKVTSGIPSSLGGSPKHSYSSPTTVDVTFRKSNVDGATSPRIDEGYGTLQSSPKKVGPFC